MNVVEARKAGWIPPEDSKLLAEAVTFLAKLINSNEDALGVLLSNGFGTGEAGFDPTRQHGMTKTDALAIVLMRMDGGSK